MPDSRADGQGTAGYTVLDSTMQFQSSWTTVRRDRVHMPDGTVGEREIAEHMSAVGAVPLDDDDHVILLRQYRHAFGRHFLEIPAGKLDVEGEPPEDAMQRELAEEIGVRADTMRALLTFTNSAGWTTERTTVYLATGLVPAARPDGFELTGEEADMEVLRVDFDEAVAMVHRGEIVDSKTVIGLLAIDSDRRPSR